MAINDTPKRAPEEIKEKIDHFLRLGIETDKGEHGGEDALDLIAELYSAYGNRFPEDEGMRRFKSDVVHKMKSGTNPHRLAIYIADCYLSAGAWEPEEYSLSRYMRSLLQLFSDEFIDVEQVVPEPDRGQIREIDGLMQRARPDVEPLREVTIPDWVPGSHWWWKTGRAPGDALP